MKQKFRIKLIIGLLILSVFGTAHSANLTQTQVSELYVSIFGRASEGSGNAYWCSNQDNMVTAANTMLNTEPAKEYFGDTLNDNLKFIEFIYENTLGKAYSEDPDGVDYWVGELTKGKSKGQVIATLINAAMDHQWAGLPAQDQFINKVAVCNYTANTIATCPDINDLSAFVGFISGVTDSAASVAAAKGLIDLDASSASGGIKSLAVGAGHTAFVKADGSLWTFGRNSEGQLGIGNEVDQSSPIMIGSNYNIVSAGTNHTLAIDDSGSLWAWGSFQFGQLGNGLDVLDVGRYDPSYITSPIQIDAGSKYIAISAGEYYSLGIKDDNSLWAWGLGMYSKLGNGIVANQKLPVKIGDNFKAVAAGAFHTLAIKTDGSLWAWGRNMYGEVGNGGHFGSNSGQDTPVQISAPGDQFKAIAAGGFNSLAIKEDGSLWTWGRTEDGKLGLGEDPDMPGYPATSNQNSPVKIPISGNFVSIDIGTWHSVALQDNGDIWSWGHNTSGELGVEESAGENAYGSPILTDRFSPTLMGHDYIAIGAGTFNTVAIKKDISVDSCGKTILEDGGTVYKYFLTYGIFQ